MTHYFTFRRSCCNLLVGLVEPGGRHFKFVCLDRFPPHTETVQLIWHPPSQALFEIFPSFPPFPSPASSAFHHFFPNADPHPLMPPKNGPWALEGVKRRLRQEQVDRERAASAWYRLREERDNLQDFVPFEARNAGSGGSSNCYLFVLVFLCVILSLVILVLCGTVVSLLHK